MDAFREKRLIILYSRPSHRSTVTHKPQSYFTLQAATKFFLVPVDSAVPNISVPSAIEERTWIHGIIFSGSSYLVTEEKHVCQNLLAPPSRLAFD